MIGQTLSHFTITGHLGSGGMGDVYRATDTTLGRDVAIKVLPAAVATDADRLARFRREANLLASLNHPRIAAIYGFGVKFWTPDARTLIYLVQHEGRNTVFTVHIDPPSPPVQLPLEGELIDVINVSPDGRWLTYIASEHGQHEVFMQPFGRPGERIRVSPDGGGQPRWRADGTELYYVTPTGALMAVKVGPNGELAQTHERLFDIVAAVSYGEQYAPARDGRRFLVMLPVQTGLSPLRLVSRWRTAPTASSP